MSWTPGINRSMSIAWSSCSRRAPTFAPQPMRHFAIFWRLDSRTITYPHIIARVAKGGQNQAKWVRSSPEIFLAFRFLGTSFITAGDRTAIQLLSSHCQACKHETNRKFNLLRRRGGHPSHRWTRRLSIPHVAAPLGFLEVVHHERVQSMNK